MEYDGMLAKVVDDSWNFRGANTKYYTHGLHSYPAMMIPQVASRLIKENLGNGNSILDPFCGSGTVLVESMIVNKNSYGVDINPLAKIISESKTTLYDIDELKEAAIELLQRIESTRNIEAPSFFNIDFWFKQDVIEELARIKHNVEKLSDSKRIFFMACFSEIVRKASNVRQGGFKLHRLCDEKLKAYNRNTLELFKKHVGKSIKKLEEFERVLDSPPAPKILLHDMRKKSPIEDDSIDLVVTSPPYGDSRTTVAYGQFSRLSLQWLGYNEKEVKNLDKMLLGGVKADEAWKTSTPTLNEFVEKISEKDAKRADDVASFYIDLDKCFTQLATLTAKRAKICMVIGNRTVKGYQLPTHRILKEMGENHGMNHVKTIFRDIPSKRIPSRNSPTNVAGITSETMTKEAIVIMQKM